MDMGFSHWMALESAMQGDQPRRAFSRATLRRIVGFARPHRRALVAFLLLSVVAAVLTVATPVLAGQVVDEIIERRERGPGRRPGRRSSPLIAVARRRRRHRRALAVVAGSARG